VSLRIHGLVYVYFEVDAEPEEAIRQFKEAYPEAEVQGIEPQEGAYIEFVGTCEICRAAIFQNTTYSVTENGIRHSECQPHENYAI
jgi:hypothetical protein